MPRTRVGHKKTENLDRFKETLEIKKMELIRYRTLALEAFRKSVRLDNLSISNSIRNMKISELKKGNQSLWHASNITNSLMQTNNSISNSVNKTKKQSSIDEGYLTSEMSGTSGDKRRLRSSSTTRITNVPLQSTQSTRRSRSCSRSTVKPKRISRSNSKLRTPSSKNNYKTPLNTKRLDSVSVVTPKIKANTPVVVLRRPAQGELAISMQGSPLMTTNWVAETTANLNIPLPDGRMVTIQPTKGIRASEVPTLPIEIREQLRTLRENLERVCQYSKV